MADIIIAIIAIAIIGGAIAYIVRQKKKGVKCIGCTGCTGGSCKCKK